jgi:tripartite-type tricarboxylate transporter receptor subunit TctC
MEVEAVTLTRTLAAACAALAIAAPVLAQTDYPTKPVRIMVGASAGGGTDVIARMLAEKFAESLKQPFVVENRPGASNTIAADLTAKAAPDGGTLLVATNTGQAIAPHMLKLAYDPLKDLTPVGLIVVVPNVLVVGDKVPVKDVKELVAMAKAKPGALRYASSGIGSTQHIAGEGFDLAAGIKTVHVPYKGSSQAHTDILGGNVEMMFDTTSSAMPQIKAGRFKPLAVTSPTRSAELPNVPTIAEAGYPAAEMTTWYGLYVTGNTPKPVVDKLAAELKRVLALPDVQAKLRGLGGEPGTISAEQFAAMNKAEYERFGKLIKTANIKAE